MHYNLLINTRTKYLTLFIFCLIFLSSCLRSNIFEKNVAIKNFKWNENNKIPFTFHLSDTTASYSMYFTMRHTDAYPFSNIWLNIQTQFPNKDSTSNSKVEIPLADAEGKWLSRGSKGMNEVWEHRMLIASPLKFSLQGDYTITLSQIMRINPLPEIMSVGIRLEKNQ